MQGMIWSDPWVSLATSPGGTDIPPPAPSLPDGVAFDSVQAEKLNIAEWHSFIGSRLSEQQLTERIGGDWVAVLRIHGSLAATCVLRPRGSTWLLETVFVPISGRGSGYATLLTRSVMTWIWRRVGRFTLAYTWELSLPALVWAWWRGWLRSAASVERGWMLGRAPCGFCESGSVGGRFNTPMLFRDEDGSAVILDSGLGDSVGYLQMWNGTPAWSAIMERGGWSSLWCHAPEPPAGEWRWTGEFVVVGALNGSVPKQWISAEISTDS